MFEGAPSKERAAGFDVLSEAIELWRRVGPRDLFDERPEFAFT
jgi:hypothetical protein